MVRSHLDYCSSVWSPYMKGNIEAVEKSLHDSAETKTHDLHWQTESMQQCRRIWRDWDMIEIYKILTGRYETKRRQLPLWVWFLSDKKPQIEITGK